MKKAMKIIAVIFIILAVVAAAVICVTSGYFADIPWGDISAEQIEAYLNEKVIPIAVVVISAVGTVMMAVLPVMNVVKRASEKFSSAEEGLKTTSADTKKTQNETKKLFEGIDLRMKKMYDVCQKADEKMDKLANMESRIEEMMLIGFCNNPDLVRNGYAKMIYDASTKGEKSAPVVKSTADGEIATADAETSTEGENDGEEREATDDDKET